MGRITAKEVSSLLMRMLPSLAGGRAGCALFSRYWPASLQGFHAYLCNHFNHRTLACDWPCPPIPGPCHCGMGPDCTFIFMHLTRWSLSASIPDQTAHEGAIPLVLFGAVPLGPAQAQHRPGAQQMLSNCGKSELEP